MKFRHARHTDRLQALIDFYTQIIGLEILGSFQDHDGYDGVFLGVPGAGWHLEFTTSDEASNHHPDPDDLLVFYPESKAVYDAIVSRINQQDIPLFIPRNRYWQINGISISDPDGFGIVVSDRFAKESN
jgi:catechol-2,3-dioxygenase